MRKLVALATIAAFAGLPAAAGAHSKSKVYKGSFQLVGADGSYTNDSFGKAHLVDGKRNDLLSVHVRKLGPRAKYVFRLQSAATACEQGAAGGTDVPGWKYRRDGLLTTNRKGGANSWARSHSFTVDRSVEYFVGVFTRDASGKPDQLVACAQLTKKKKAHGKPPKKDGGDKGQSKDKDKGAKGQGKDKGHGNDKPRGDDKPHGNGQGNGNGHGHP